MNRHGTNLLTNGTNCLRLPGRHYLPIQRRFERKRIEYSSANRKTMASNKTADDQSKRMYTIDIVIKLLQHVSPPCNKEVGDLLPDIGINSGSVTNMRGVAEAVQSLHFYHIGHLVWNIHGHAMCKIISDLYSIYVGNLNHYQASTLAIKWLVILAGNR